MAYDPRTGAFLDKPPQNPKSVDKNTPAQNLGEEAAYAQGNTPPQPEPDFKPYFDQPGPVVNAQQDPLLNYFRDKYWWPSEQQPEGESYWEDPWRVARYKNVADSAPDGSALPPWLQENREKLDAAYEYMRWANEDAPWYAWRKPTVDDPYREFARSIPAPPDDALWPGEEKYKQPTQPPATEQPTAIDPAAAVQELELGGLSEAEYQALPDWQRLMIGIMGNAKSAGALTGGIAGLAGGPMGVAVGATLGAGLGGLSESAPSLAKYLMYLDYPAEWIERALGTLSIPLEAGWKALEEGKPLISGMPGQPGPESVASAIAEVLNNLPAAWQAGHLTYDVADIPLLGEAEGSIWQLGQGEQVQLGPGQVGGDALLEAFDRINNGEAPEAVYEDIQQRLGFSGQAREFLGHLVIDPLNVIGGFVNDIIAIGGKMTGNDVLTVAALNTKGPAEAAQQYGNLLRATTPVQDIARMDAVSRWLGGVDAAGNIRSMQQPGPQGLLSRGAGAVVTGGPAAAIGFGIGGPLGGMAGAALGGKYGWNRGFDYLFSMTPSARATELVNNGAINLQLLLERAGGDPDTMVAYIKSMAATPNDLARQLSMNSIEAPEGVAVGMALKDFGRNADEMLTAWKATEWQRTTLDNIAQATGRTPEDVLRALGDERNTEILLRQFGDAARQSGDEAAAAVVQAIDNGDLTARSLQEIGKNFTKNGLPHNEEMFRAQLYSAATEHMAQWGADWFGVKPDPTFERLGQTVKSAQSLVLLGLNPSYFVNNVINNIVTSAATGVFGLRTPEKINGIWQRIGVTPERLRSGIGAGEVGEVAQFGPIREAGRVGDSLQTLNDFFKKGSDKVGLFSKLSSTAEEWSSAQAYTSGFMQAWGRLWQRGSGYDPMPAALDRALRNIDDGLPDLVNQAIRGGLNRAEVEAALWSGVTRRGVDHWIPDVADAHGIPAAQAREMMSHLGIDEFLRERLSGDVTEEQIARAFEDLDDTVERHLNDMTRQELVDEAARVRERVAGEGPQAALELYDRIEVDEAQRWLENFDEWERVFAETGDMDYGQRNVIIRRQFELEGQKWDRFWEHKQATYAGIGDALGIEAQSSRQFIDRLVGNVDNWKEFHTTRRENLNRFFNTIFDSREIRNAAWEDLQRQLDELYVTHSQTERRLQREMDNIFSGMFGTQYGQAAGDAAQQWRSGVYDIRLEMTEEMRGFRQSLNTRRLTPEQRRAEWSTFLNEQYRVSIVDRMRANIEGAHEMYRIAMGGEGGAPAPVTPRPEPPAPAPAPAPAAVRQTAATAPQEAIRATQSTTLSGNEPRVVDAAETVRTVAGEYGLATADDAGAPVPGADQHILNIVKKYGGQETQTVTTLDDVTPALARKAFDERQRVKRFVSNAETTDLLKPGEMAAFKREAERRRNIKPEVTEYDRQVMGGYAQELLNEIEDTTGVTFREINDGKGYVRDTDNPQWYRDLYKAGYTNKKSVIGALRKIAEGKITEGKYVQGVLDVILRRMSGEEGSMLGAHPGTLLELGEVDAAAQAVGDLLQIGVSYDDILKSVGNDEAALDALFVRLGEIEKSLSDRPPDAPATEQLTPRVRGDDAMRRTIELKQSGATVDEIAADLRVDREIVLRLLERAADLDDAAEAALKYMGDIKQRERVIRRMGEWGARVDQPLALPQADPRQTLRRGFVDVMGLADDEAAAVIALTDARAQAWAKANGRAIDEWYGKRIAGLLKSDSVEGMKQLPKGAVQFLDDGRAMIYAMSQSDVSTAVHEVGHIFRRDLEKADLKIAEEWAGVERGVWERTHEEKFARAFERYLRDGKAPNVDGLAGVFEKFKRWMTRIYTTIVGGPLDVEVSPEIRGVFDRLLGEEVIKPIGLDQYRVELEQARRDLNNLTNVELKQATIKKVIESHPFDMQITSRWREGDQTLQTTLGELELIGSGGFKHVYSRDDLPYVIKVSTVDDPINEFVLMKSYQDTGLFPVVFGVGREPGLFYSVIEKVQPLEVKRVNSTVVIPVGGEMIEEVFWDKKGNVQELLGIGDYHNPENYGTTADGRLVVLDAFDWNTSGRIQTLRDKIHDLDNIMSGDPIAVLGEGLISPGQFENLEDALASMTEKLIIIGQYEGIDSLLMRKLRMAVDRLTVEVQKQRESINDVDWFDTDTGAKRTLYQDIIQDADGTVEPIKLNGDDPEAAPLPLGEVERHDNAPPLRSMQDEAWRNTIKPMMDTIRGRMTGPDAQVPVSVKGADLDPVTMRNLRAYMEQVYGQMSDTKLAAIRWGENRRDAALLNYSRRYGVDNTIQSIFPYHFWYTRSALQWALRGIDRPAWMANYARLRDMQERVVAMPGFPSRLRGKMRVPVPFMPAWAGTAVYVDPLHQLFPFEQMARPFELPFEEKNQQERRAMYLLQEMVANDEVNETEAQAAWRDKTGALWQQVITQAQLEVESEIANPFDFMSLISGPSLPVGIGYNMAMGRSKKISQLPVTRAIQSATAWATPGGINIEGPIRRALGLDERGEFWDFYVDRELANMVATGAADLDAAMLAMVERSGAVYDQATDRVGKVQATRFAGSSLWLDFFPEGEQVQRNLQQQFGAAIDSGDPTAVNEFFNKHPEYQARLLMTNWDDPEERMRRFLISEVWKGYGELPDLTRRELTEEFGDIFGTAFLDKETRSYDAIDTDTLAWWAQSMGGTVPEGGPDIPQQMGGGNIPGAEVTQAYQDYVDTRRAQYGGAVDLQGLYFGLPEDKRAEFLASNPQLKEYWAWKDEYLAKHPEIIPYATGEDSKAAGYPPETQQAYYQYKAVQSQQFPDVYDLMDEYFDLRNSGAKRKFLQENPQLPAYWDWQKQVMAGNPELIPLIKSPESLAKSVLGNNYKEKYGLPAPSFDPADFPAALNRQLMSGDLSAGGKKWLRQYWEQKGKPAGTFESFLAMVVNQ